MITIPVLKATILTAEERRILQGQILKGFYAKQNLRIALESLESVTRLATALSEALDICVEALKNESDATVALDQAQTVLTVAYKKEYPGEDPLDPRLP